MPRSTSSSKPRVTRASGPKSRWSALLSTVLLASLAAGCQSGGTAEIPPPTAPTKAALGVYAGPGPKGVTGAQQFSSVTGTRVSRVLDFLPQESWRAMTDTDWLMEPYRSSDYHLELSVPMLPAEGDTSLSDCASGAYDEHWRLIATKLQSHHLGSASIRPGWEFNGDWYDWSASGEADAYLGCFRRIVTTMRAVSPGFTFIWSVNVGVNKMSAEEAWPGDDYVDYVGLDVYDYSSHWYPVPDGMSKDSARREAWNTTLDGDHGLAYWVRFARSHGKPLGLDEWGLAWRADGHAGGDNALFIEEMLGFIKNPANRVAYANYFNSPDTDKLRHSITASGSSFPKATARFEELAGQR